MIGLDRRSHKSRRPPWHWDVLVLMSVQEVVWLEAWGKGLSAAGNTARVCAGSLRGPGWSGEDTEGFPLHQKRPGQVDTKSF